MQRFCGAPSSVPKSNPCGALLSKPWKRKNIALLTYIYTLKCRELSAGTLSSPPVSSVWGYGRECSLTLEVLSDILLEAQGVRSFLPTPNFPMCQSPKLATPRNGRVQDLPPLNSPELGTLPFLGVASPWLCHFLGRPVWDSLDFLDSST